MQSTAVLIVIVIHYLMFALFYESCAAQSHNNRNVLFLIVDDLRPEIGCFQEKDQSKTRMHTPNLDSLAKRSILFQRAYVQQAVCSPSRTSLLTGRRPDTTRVHDLTQYWRHAAGNFTTLPQFLKENGYRTAGLGKVFHPGRASGHNDPISWTEKYFSPNELYWQNRSHDSWFAASEEEILSHPLPDMQIANAAVKMMHQLASQKDKPFFLAIGFLKPHLPFLFPARYLDLYPLSNITLPENPFAPYQMPEFAWSNFDEIRKYDDIQTKYGYGSINTTFPDDVVLNLRRAYYASVSYIDLLIGMVLDALSQLGLVDNTVISFLGDHGWQLGEHGEWCKHTNFELATRAPLMLSIPNLTESSGIIARTTALVEFVDVFPTIVEAVGLPVPDLCPDNSSSLPLCIEGSSLIRLIKDPIRHWKSAVFSQFPRMLVSGDVLMGYSMRTKRYRYTEWIFYDVVKFQPIWEKKRKYFELYDHKTDPEENANVGPSPAYSLVVEKLSKDLREGWRNALPP